MLMVFLIIPLLRISLVLASADEYPKLPEKNIYNLEEAGNHFAAFIKEYNKHYDKDEATYRLKVFKDNLRRFNEWNKNSDSAVYGITSLADLTREEFMSLGNIAEESTVNVEYIPDYYEDSLNNDYYYYYLFERNLFEKDWRKVDAVAEVKDQGHCASSYIFSAIGVLEGQYAMKYRKRPIPLSTQQVLDCNAHFACNSSTYTAGDVILSLIPKGVMSEKDYPYAQEKSSSCKFNKDNVVVSVKMFNEFSLQNERSLGSAVSINGPVAIRLRLSEQFQGYKGGVFNASDCYYPSWKKKLPTHYFLLVGHGKSDDDRDYWIIKNSWGKKWGENGYLRLQSFEHTCNIGDYVSHATIY